MFSTNTAREYLVKMFLCYFKPIFQETWGNILFIETNIEPSALVEAIFDDITTLRKMKTLHCSRLVPINATCTATVDDIVGIVKNLTKDVFVENYCIEWEGFEGEVEMDMKNIADGMIAEYLSLNVVSHTQTNTDLVIVIRLLDRVCCIGLLWYYERYKGYNIDNALLVC